MQGFRVYDLRNMTLLSSIPKSGGAITHAEWVTRNSGGRIVETLCLGTNTGALELWEEEDTKVNA